MNYESASENSSILQKNILSNIKNQDIKPIELQNLEISSSFADPIPEDDEQQILKPKTKKTRKSKNQARSVNLPNKKIYPEPEVQIGVLDAKSTKINDLSPLLVPPQSQITTFNPPKHKDSIKLTPDQSSFMDKMSVTKSHIGSIIDIRDVGEEPFENPIIIENIETPRLRKKSPQKQEEIQSPEINNIDSIDEIMIQTLSDIPNADLMKLEKEERRNKIIKDLDNLVTLTDEGIIDKRNHRNKNDDTSENIDLTDATNKLQDQMIFQPPDILNYSSIDMSIKEDKKAKKKIVGSYLNKRRKGKNNNISLDARSRKQADDMNKSLEKALYDDAKSRKSKTSFKSRKNFYESGGEDVEIEDKDEIDDIMSVKSIKYHVNTSTSKGTSLKSKKKTEKVTNSSDDDEDSDDFELTEKDISVSRKRPTSSTNTSLQSRKTGYKTGNFEPDTKSLKSRKSALKYNKYSAALEEESSDEENNSFRTKPNNVAFEEADNEMDTLKTKSLRKSPRSRRSKYDQDDDFSMKSKSKTKNNDDFDENLSRTSLRSKSKIKSRNEEIDDDLSLKSKSKIKSRNDEIDDDLSLKSKSSRRVFNDEMTFGDNTIKTRSQNYKNNDYESKSYSMRTKQTKDKRDFDGSMMDDSLLSVINEQVESIADDENEMRSRVSTSRRQTSSLSNNTLKSRVYREHNRESNDDDYEIEDETIRSKVNRTGTEDADNEEQSLLTRRNNERYFNPQQNESDDETLISKLNEQVESLSGDDDESLISRSKVHHSRTKDVSEMDTINTKQTKSQMSNNVSQTLSFQTKQNPKNFQKGDTTTTEKSLISRIRSQLDSSDDDREDDTTLNTNLSRSAMKYSQTNDQESILSRNLSKQMTNSTQTNSKSFGSKLYRPNPIQKTEESSTNDTLISRIRQNLDTDDSEDFDETLISKRQSTMRDNTNSQSVSQTINSRRPTTRSGTEFDADESTMKTFMMNNLERNDSSQPNTIYTQELANTSRYSTTDDDEMSTKDKQTRSSSSSLADLTTLQSERFSRQISSNSDSDLPNLHTLGAERSSSSSLSDVSDEDLVSLNKMRQKYASITKSELNSIQTNKRSEMRQTLGSTSTTNNTIASEKMSFSNRSSSNPENKTDLSTRMNSTYSSDSESMMDSIVSEAKRNKNNKSRTTEEFTVETIQGEKQNRTYSSMMDNSINSNVNSHSSRSKNASTIPSTMMTEEQSIYSTSESEMSESLVSEGKRKQNQRERTSESIIMQSNLSKVFDTPSNSKTSEGISINSKYYNQKSSQNSNSTIGSSQMTTNFESESESSSLSQMDSLDSKFGRKKRKQTETETIDLQSNLGNSSSEMPKSSTTSTGISVHSLNYNNRSMNSKTNEGSTIQDTMMTRDESESLSNSESQMDSLESEVAKRKKKETTQTEEFTVDSRSGLLFSEKSKSKTSEGMSINSLLPSHKSTSTMNASELSKESTIKTFTDEDESTYVSGLSSLSDLESLTSERPRQKKN
ncbi:hypothetical protein TVAGG3_0964510, partial [Trichomonas vaginalis G3]